MKTILITGAAGGVGSFLRKEFLGRYRLRLSDIAPLDDCGPDKEFVEADLGDPAALRNAVAGVDGIVHLGGFSVEGDWDTILNANIVGTYNLFEAARLAGVNRIVFASSNHAMGFYGRDETVDHNHYPRPDSRYGLANPWKAARRPRAPVRHRRHRPDGAPHAAAPLALAPPGPAAGSCRETGRAAAAAGRYGLAGHARPPEA